MEKMTRQGVRDLNHIKGHSIGKRLSEPPQEAQVCHHTHRSNLHTGDSKCRDCGQLFDWDGRPW